MEKICITGISPSKVLLHSVLATKSVFWTTIWGPDHWHRTAKHPQTSMSLWKERLRTVPAILEWIQLNTLSSDRQAVRAAQWFNDCAMYTWSQCMQTLEMALAKACLLHEGLCGLLPVWNRYTFINTPLQTLKYCSFAECTFHKL